MTSNKKRLLVFVCDLGAIQIITSLYHLLSANFEISLLLSKEQKIKSCMDFKTVESNEDVLTHIKNFCPDLILLGTSSGNLIEPFIIKSARSLKIKTISFVDQWHNYTLRFTHLDQLVLPDKILFPDENALYEFKREVSEQPTLVACGQPYLAQIRKLNRPKKQSKELQVLLISEPISKYLDKAQKDVLYGFDEKILLKSTLKVLNHLNAKYKCTVKIHPKESGYLKTHSKRFKVFHKTMSHNQLVNFDMIIGMHSTMLIEAYLLDLNVIVFHPRGENHFDHCMLSRFGFTERVTTTFALMKKLKKKKRTQKRLAIQEYKLIDFLKNIN